MQQLDRKKEEALDFKVLILTGFAMQTVVTACNSTGRFARPVFIY